MAPEVYRYQAPAEATGHATDLVSPIDTKEGVIASGGVADIRANDHQFRGTTSPIDPSDWRSTARTRAGAPVLPEQINQSTIVEINGRRDTVQAFQIMGMLPADLSQAPTVAKQIEPPKQEEPKDDRPPVPRDARELWEATEQVVVPLLEQTGTTGYAAVEAMITKNERAFDATIRSLSSASGIEPEQMRETVQTAFAQYIEVSRKAVGMSPEEWDIFTSFCDKYPQERAEAARKVFHEGDLNPLRALVAQYKEAGGGWAAAANDDNVFAAVTAMGVKASRTSNGTTMLHLREGTMSWREALKRGLIEFA